MHIGSKVVTPHGAAVIEHIEHFSRLNGGTNRYGVTHVNKPLLQNGGLTYYWPHEIASTSGAPAILH